MKHVNGTHGLGLWHRHDANLSSESRVAVAETSDDQGSASSSSSRPLLTTTRVASAAGGHREDVAEPQEQPPTPQRYSQWPKAEAVDEHLDPTWCLRPGSHHRARASARGEISEDFGMQDMCRPLGSAKLVRDPLRARGHTTSQHGCIKAR